MMGIRINYRGATLRRRVLAAGDKVETTLLHAGPQPLYHVDRAVTPHTVTQLRVGQTLSHARGAASVTSVKAAAF